MRAMEALHNALDSGAPHFLIVSLASDVLMHAACTVRIFAKTHEEFMAANLLLRASSNVFSEENTNELPKTVCS